MSTLHDVLHNLADRIAYPSEGHRDAAHAEISAIPDFVEQLDAEQLDAEHAGDADDDQEQETNPS